MNRKGDGEHFQTNGLIHLFIFYDKVLDIYFFSFQTIKNFLLLNGNAFLNGGVCFLSVIRHMRVYTIAKGPGLCCKQKKKKEEN